MMILGMIFFYGCGKSTHDNSMNHGVGQGNGMATGVGQGNGMNPGVEQGNDMVLYHSIKYGFALSYHEKLTINEDNNGNIRIDNSDYIKNINNEKSKSLIKKDNVSKVSYIEVKVVKNLDYNNSKVDTVEKLLEYLSENFHNIDWPEIKFPGASGYYYEEKNGENLKAHYYILTINKELIEINLDVFKFANGLEWIAPIVNTFVYDITAPVIHEVKVEKDFVVGKNNKILIHATDDFSGVSTKKQDAISVIIRNTSNSDVYIYSSCTLISLENNWYQCNFEISKYNLPGEYWLGDIIIKDNARNYGSTDFDEFNDNDWIKVNIINNEQPDITGPVIHEVKVEQDFVAGKTNKILINATDDFSGILTNKWHGFSVHLTNDSISDMFIDYSCKLISLGSNWYQCDFEVSKYIAPGEYKIYAMKIVDNASNYTSKSIAHDSRIKVNIINNEQSDITGPVINEIKIEQDFFIGKTNKMLINATDDFSGILTNGWAVHILNTYTKAAYIRVECDLIPLGNNWYQCNFEISKYNSPGEYCLSHVWMQDNAGNSTNKDFDENNGIKVIVKK